MIPVAFLPWPRAKSAALRSLTSAACSVRAYSRTASGFPRTISTRTASTRSHYTYRSPKCALKYQMGSRGVVKNGKHVSEPIYAEPSKEQLAGVFVGALESAPVVVSGAADEAGRPYRPRMGRFHRLQ